MKLWPRAIAVVDYGGDFIARQAFADRWRGRVYLCTLTGDHMTKELLDWKTGNESGFVTADRNRMIQFTIDHFRDKRIPVHGTEGEWLEYWLDWNNLSKMKVLDPDTNQVKGYKFIRSGRDHLALATVFWMVGMQRFSAVGELIYPDSMRRRPNSYIINPNKTVSFNPDQMFNHPHDPYDARASVEEALKHPDEDPWWTDYR